MMVMMMYTKYTTHIHAENTYIRRRMLFTRIFSRRGKSDQCAFEIIYSNLTHAWTKSIFLPMRRERKKSKNNFFTIFSFFLCLAHTIGIHANQQHLLYNQKELPDSMTLRDVPVFDGIRFKLVLGMKVGPIQSVRRVIPTMSDCDNWFDINDVVQHSK